MKIHTRSKRPKIEFGDKKGKKVVTSLIETTTLMETQECGEMMEHVDEVNFGLDGLRRGQPVRVRRSSLLSLLNVCGTLQQRRLLRTHGTARTIIDAVLGLSLDDTPSNLAAAALFFVLTSDGQDDFLLDSPNSIRFLLKLLKPATVRATKNKVTTLGSKLVALSKDVSIFNDGKGDESSAAALLQKVEEVLLSCKELKPRSGSDSETKRPELTPKWIALLTMEKACLSTVSLEESTGTVRKMGGNFKEKLREHGGLDAVIDIIRECHGVMEGWLERYTSPTPESQNIVDLESPILLLKCLKIMENATFLSNDNQSHLLGEEDFGYRNVSQSFTKLILNVIKILSGVSLMKSSPSNSGSRNGNSLSNGTAHISDRQSQADDNVDNNEIIYISSATENGSMDLISSQKNSSTSQKNKQLGSSKADPISGFNSQLLKITAKSSTSRSSSGTSSSLKNGSKHGKKLGKKSETSQRTRHDTFDFEDSQDPFGSQDPFAFDDDVGELMSKWDLMSGKKNLSQSQKSSSAFEDDEYGCKDIVLLSQQESSNMERHDSPPQASCSHVIDDEKLNLLADCLLASVKVLMNLTNDNSVGCRQIAACGGLETLCGLIAGHYPSFSSYLPTFSDPGEKSIVLEGNNKRLNDQELDFLVAILGLLVNLVEKDGRNRSRLAAASISIPSSSGSDYEITDVIPLLCSIFLANQGAGEAAEEGRQSVWNDEDPILEGEKEAEKTIVEAYSALLLAFLSTESKSIRNAVAECLPKRNLSILVPVLERFLEFHMSLNMISEETHSMVLEVIESCRML
ncbi:WAPL (Wings apart-like protein regulation of heterochromatin) protein [Artemisia annua]|uniref:WAPL (Wings apart-like protein regulation of heterochromatin) protein n=1 Tax=Artemisia annua TaxID=35608 RepID=A0A2U1QIN8_ARTAN|nr:WAPL (Wings apart-like protein regulation of heterochromatin) protein [Artemisia annua]